MSSKLKGTITRVSNGSIEFTPTNSFDLQKLQPGSVCEVTIDVVTEDRRAASLGGPTSGGLSAVAAPAATVGQRVPRT